MVRKRASERKIDIKCGLSVVNLIENEVKTDEN